MLLIHRSEDGAFPFAEAALLCPSSYRFEWYSRCCVQEYRPIVQYPDTFHNMCRQTGAADYAEKPFEPAFLLSEQGASLSARYCFGQAADHFL